MTLHFLPDRIENHANRARLEEVSRVLGGSLCTSPVGAVIAVENMEGATAIYGRRRTTEDTTLVLGNERRGVSKRMLAMAHEIVAIPTVSRSVRTLNVAAAAAVAGWYISHGSRAQREASDPDRRRPALLLVGDDHVEIGSSLRSAAALGYRDVFLEDRGAGWFDGPNHIRREAYAAARRHKNPLRAHRATIGLPSAFEEVVFVLPAGEAPPLERLALARGRRQLIVVGAHIQDFESAPERTRACSLGLVAEESVPLRVTASIALAEVARQVGRRVKARTGRQVRRPSYDAALTLADAGTGTLLIDADELLTF
jgi:hypothetical protein